MVFRFGFILTFFKIYFFDFITKLKNNCSENHKTGGTMHIERSPQNKFIEKFRDGAIELGLPLRDPNHGSKQTEGIKWHLKCSYN